MRAGFYTPIYKTRPPVKASVLIVDDDVAIRKLIAEVLELEGYAIYGAAAHGLEALAQLRASPKQLLVITGHMMPVMTGLVFLEHVANDKALSTRHRFVMTTASSEPAGHPILTLLDVPLISKPFTVPQLLDAIAYARRRLPSHAGDR